ncbi:BMT3, partial [[Candida] subhashii]
KFAGTSVWLEEYGVHLMVSRVVFSYTGIRWDPQISLLYAQVYDKNWTELHDVDLIIPIKNPTNLQREYKRYTFPRFMPIPFYYNSNLMTKRWYGPEDARLFLMKNEYNETEPALIFNAYHRKPVKNSISNDDKSASINFQMYRSMFIGFLFQFQLGKRNTDGTTDERFDHIQYNRVAELRIKSRERKEIEKNWTPIVDLKDSENINLIYEAEHLTILKCPLKTVYKGEITCDISFNQSRLFGRMGEVRGGTELIPILNENDPNKQTWIGFLRAHINDCGCGASMYRPNFIVLTRILDSYKITHLSSSISFDIPVTGSKNSSIVCDETGPNVLIPNGISMWEVEPKTGVDYLTLSLSVADESNSVLHITGISSLLDDIQKRQDDIGYWYDEAAIKDMFECVLQTSKDFCKLYGEEQIKLGKSDQVNAS